MTTLITAAKEARIQANDIFSAQMIRITSGFVLTKKKLGVRCTLTNF